MSKHSSQPRRVVITGLGLVSPLGSSPEAFWQALQERRSGIDTFAGLSPLPAGLPLRYAGEARQFTGDIGSFGDIEADKKKAVRKALKVMCRETQMAVAAAGMALTNAQLTAGSIDPERGGVVLGSDYMLTMPEDYVDGITRCTAPDEQFDFNQWGSTGLDQMTPLWMLKYLPNMPASHIAILHDLRGPNNSLTLREAASNLAVGEAFRTIARGHAEVMLAGATGTRVQPMQAIHAMQTEELAQGEVDPATASRPFDKNRLGMVAGEGAAVIVLEERDAAIARGATIYAEVLGLGASTVADRQLRGDTRRALAGAMQSALADAGLTADQVGHINAHGLATRQGDIDEAGAIREVFGDQTADLPVTALKSYFGNLGAGSGVVELIGSVLALHHGQLPRVLNYQSPDPQCDLLVSDGNQSPGSTFLNLSITPQGQAAVVAVGAPER